MNLSNFMSHFGFLSEPFSKTIDAKNLFISKQLQQLFEKLKLLLGRRGMALLTGNVGAGKTTALRAFIERLDKNQYDIVYLDNPTLGLKGIFNSIATQLNLDSQFFKWRLIPALKAAIEKNFNDYKKTTLLIIDDVQLLSTHDLEEFRLFTNFRIDSHSPLTLILLAQPEFRKIIQLKSLQALAQRIALRTHLTGIEQDEIQPYIQHQLEIAGRTDHLFSDDLITEIYQQARGIPRLINTLCYECLVESFLQKKNIVDIPTLEKVMINYEIL
jgi:type II secretory pathway predicted ATPase ExeA